MQNKLRFISLVGVLAGSLVGSTSVFAQQGQELTGDPKLACDAILCLSSGTRPGECGPALSRYFGIDYKYWSDTVKGRRNFLNQCPTAQDTSSANMPQIVDNIANSAGRCDAAYLNANNRTVARKKICPQNGWQTGGNAWWNRNGGWMSPDDSWTQLDDGSGCYVRNVVVVSNAKPANCSAYANSQYTYLLGVRYVGDPADGGHWVDDSMGGQ
jgi:hypothetical protein